MDSAKLRHGIERKYFCDGAEPSPLINDLYAEIYNMRGNVCVRQGLTVFFSGMFSKSVRLSFEG